MIETKPNLVGPDGELNPSLSLQELARITNVIDLQPETEQTTEVDSKLHESEFRSPIQEVLEEVYELPLNDERRRAAEFMMQKVLYLDLALEKQAENRQKREQAIILTFFTAAMCVVLLSLSASESGTSPAIAAGYIGLLILVSHTTSVDVQLILNAKSDSYKNEIEMLRNDIRLLGLKTGISADRLIFSENIIPSLQDTLINLMKDIRRERQLMDHPLRYNTLRLRQLKDNPDHVLDPDVEISIPRRRRP